MLLHCGGGNAAWWQYVTPVLQSNFHLIVPELSGHGASGHRDAYSPDIWAQEAHSIIKEVATGPVAIAGHSMGALVAIYVAALYPESVSTLILVDPPVQSVWVRDTPPASRDYPTKKSALKSFRLRPPETFATEDLLQNIAAASVGEVDGGWAWRFDPRASQRFDVPGVKAALEKIIVPVGCIRGGMSQYVTIDTVSYMEELLKRPVEAITIPRAYHHVPLDAPVELAKAINEIHARLTSAQASLQE